jgi:hypothetical protein
MGPAELVLEAAVSTVNTRKRDRRICLATWIEPNESHEIRLALDLLNQTMHPESAPLSGFNRLLVSAASLHNNLLLPSYRHSHSPRTRSLRRCIDFRQCRQVVLTVISDFHPNIHFEVCLPCCARLLSTYSSTSLSFNVSFLVLPQVGCNLRPCS